MITVYWPSGRKMRTLSDDDFKNLTAEELLYPHIEYQKSSEWYFTVYPDRMIMSSGYKRIGTKVHTWQFDERNLKEDIWWHKKDWYIWYCSYAGYTVCWRYYSFLPDTNILWEEDNFDMYVAFFLEKSNGISNSNCSATTFNIVEHNAWDDVDVS